MNKTELISKMIRDTFIRAATESAVAVIIMGLLAYQMQTTAPETQRYYGTILIIASLGFIMGVLWSYVVAYRTLRVHPETDSAFWREAFQTQARLLRSVPLWYLAPTLTGVLISVLPSAGQSSSLFMLMLALCGVLFCGLTWLNRLAAQKYDEQVLHFG